MPRKTNKPSTPLPNLPAHTASTDPPATPVKKQRGRPKGYTKPAYTSPVSTAKPTLHGMIGTAIAGHWTKYSEFVGDGDKLKQCLTTVQHDRVRINSVVAGLQSLEEQIMGELHRLGIETAPATGTPRFGRVGA